MTGPYRRKKVHKEKKHLYRSYRTCNRTLDFDQIHELLAKNPDALSSAPSVVVVDTDLPGNGQFGCVHCCKHFIDQKTLTIHLNTKNHKKRIKLLKEEPYTQKEAERAAGMR